MERFINPNYSIVHGEDGIYIDEGYFQYKPLNKKAEKILALQKIKQI
jgi:hypothetical protein